MISFAATARDTLISTSEESFVAVTHGVLTLFTGNRHGAIEAGAAVHALEVFVTEELLELVLLTATHSVLVCSARRNLHLGHFFPTYLAAEALFDVVLGSRKGAFVTIPAVWCLPLVYTVFYQVGSFVALGTTDGIIQRVDVLSLWTQTLLLLPKGRDQSSDP